MTAGSTFALPDDPGVLTQAYDHLRRGSGALYEHHQRELLRDLDRRLTGLERDPVTPLRRQMKRSGLSRLVNW